ncbi:O-acetyl-ADP-ribose deacetylase (regulator of RNase III) [Metabacillus crassostreae]|uniref:macro domain-containing protein n=1 Tax=Metabacillus crassostreae TaxID=929098 RepID=UPI0019599C13|nr:macro domain-containing protein [Metabacillus crassostreae]MBM7602784.1 O-acetyl-ADP-ribose deacetylase (regulator of RNase III) [Metabacillus crassostreae]
MPLEIVRNDLTKMKVDAIVNAANTELTMGGGVCGAIFQAAGVNELKRACDEIGGCSVGQAVITEGFNLFAKYIIHTPGPIWKDGAHHEADHLQNSYYYSLELAKKYKCESVAFPLISTGIYGYPKEEALQIAVSSISKFILQHDMLVYLVVFDKEAFSLSQKLVTSINEYIDENYVEEAELQFNRRLKQFSMEQLQESKSISDDYLEKQNEPILENSLVDLMEELDESFSERLLRLIDERGMTDVDTYKRANIDRRLFSKIRNTPEYSPKKKTAIALAIALEMSKEETNELLSAAGYTLSRSSKFDVIIEFFIEHGKYDIHEINEVLFLYDQPLLGA